MNKAAYKQNKQLISHQSSVTRSKHPETFFFARSILDYPGKFECDAFPASLNALHSAQKKNLECCTFNPLQPTVKKLRLRSSCPPNLSALKTKDPTQREQEIKTAEFMQHQFKQLRFRLRLPIANATEMWHANHCPASPDMLCYLYMI